MGIPILILLAVVGVIVTVGVRRRLRARRESARPDVARVGDGDALSPGAAARRAQGTSAWTRFSGGL